MLPMLLFERPTLHLWHYLLNLVLCHFSVCWCLLSLTLSIMSWYSFIVCEPKALDNYLYMYPSVTHSSMALLILLTHSFIDFIFTFLIMLNLLGVLTVLFKLNGVISLLKPLKGDIIFKICYLFSLGFPILFPTAFYLSIFPFNMLM